MGDRRPDVLLDRRRRRLRDMVGVRKRVVALRHTGGASEVVERDCGVAALGEAERELLVEAVQPADVGEDDDSDPRAVVRLRREGGEPRAVRRLEHDVLGAHRRTAGDRRDRRDRVELEAHRGPTLLLADAYSCPETACGTYGSSSRAISSGVSSSASAARASST